MRNCALLFGFFILALTFQSAQAQVFLVLEKMGTKKRHEYYPGDKMTFMLNEERGYRTDEIAGIGQGEIYFETGSVKLEDIARIDLSSRKRAMRGIGTTVLIGGLGYMAIDLFNKTISDGDVYVDKEVARTSAIIAGTGLTLILLSKKKVNLRNNWRLRIVEI